MKKTVLICFVLITTAASLQAQSGTVQFSFFYGINHHLEYGSVDEFQAGYNNFPVMPVHSPSNFGGSFAYFITRWLGLEYDMRLTGRTEVTLADPSDGDTLTIQTPKHLSISLNILLEPLKGRISPYLLLGTGINRIPAMDETYTTTKGYEVIMLAPSENDRLDILVQGGIGVNALVYAYFGLRADVRYMVVFDDPYKIGSLNATLGLIARF
jgi:outer membrane protein W